MGNFQALIYLTKGARAMCTLNGWKKAGLLNGGGQGAAFDITYVEDQGPSRILVAILVRFKSVSEGGIIAALPMLMCPIEDGRSFLSTWPYATTIHKSQGPAFPNMSTREKGHSKSAVVFCPAFQRATFRKTKGAAAPR